MTSFLGELRRRNVFKVAVAYAIVGWLVIQIAATVLPIFETPGWILQVFTFLVILGFPLALIFSWAFELTPEGLERTRVVPQTESITHVTGRKLNLVIIALTAVGIAFLAFDRYLLEEAPTAVVADISLDENSVAVLPFDNRSAREEDQFFVDGIHDDILTQLARIGSMKVISRTSVMSYRDTEKNMRTIGAELGVATILEGGVQRAGDTIRINVQLIDAATDEHLWAETYDRMLTVENVFAIQSEMATAIATELQASLSPEDVVRLASAPTQDTRAYDFYLSGNDYFNRTDDRTYKPLAVQMYQQAVAEDPSFSLAWSALSRAHSTMYWYSVDATQSRLDAALDAVERAFALERDLPAAHVALGFYYDVGLRDYERAQQEFTTAEQALGEDPYLTELEAYMQRRLGEWAGAILRFEALIERDPRNADLLTQLGITLVNIKDYDLADHNFDRALQIAPDNALAYWWQAWLPMVRNGDIATMNAAAANPRMPLGAWRQYFGWLAALYERDYETALAYADGVEGDAFEVQGRYTPKSLLIGIARNLAGQDDLAEAAFLAARAQTEAALGENPDDPRLYIALAESLVGLGELDAATNTARTGLALMPRSRDDLSGRVLQEYAIIGVFAPSGDVDATVAELDAHLTAGSRWSIEGLLPDPRFDPVRDDPRFQALVERHRRQ